MKLIIDYTDGFEKFHTEIGDENKEYAETNSLEKSVKCLEEQYNSLLQEVSELKELLLKNTSTPVDDVEKPEQEEVLNNGHISTFKHYDNYCLERKYDVKKNRFFVSENRPSIDLGFMQLVAIIKSYKSGLPIPKMRTNPILKKYSKYSLQHYVYIWRAGGFNQAIKDHARKFGYNPDKLISTEVE